LDSQNRRLLAVGLILRFAVSAWNGFWGPSFGGEYDAASYHQLAVDFAQKLIVDDIQIGTVYPMALGFVYRVLTPSLFIGGVLSALAWLLSAYAFQGMMRKLAVSESGQSKALLIYCLLPSSIIFTGITLREAYQLLFVNLSLSAAVSISRREGLRHWVVLALSVIGMAGLHGAMFAFGVYVIFATLLFFAMTGSRRLAVVRVAFVAPLLGFVAVIGFAWFSTLSYNLDEGVDTAVQLYQQAGLTTDARTVYKDRVEIPGIRGLIVFAPVGLFEYSLEPAPWRVRKPVDVVVLVENMLRLALIFSAIRGIRRAGARSRSAAFLVLFSFGVLELIWSLGTINWGTAARHHLPGIGLLLAVSAMGFGSLRSRGDSSQRVPIRS
jgi:hypothetical protein